jgi:hypothetical protein
MCSSSNLQKTGPSQYKEFFKISPPSVSEGEVVPQRSVLGGKNFVRFLVKEIFLRWPDWDVREVLPSVNGASASQDESSSRRTNQPFGDENFKILFDGVLEAPASLLTQINRAILFEKSKNFFGRSVEVLER